MAARRQTPTLTVEEDLRQAGRRLRSLLLSLHECVHSEHCDVYQAIQEWERVDPL